MKKHNSQITTWVILLLVFTGLTGCSMMSQVGKTVRNATTFGEHKTIVKVDDSLIIPPSLRDPAASSAKQAQAPVTPRKMARANATVAQPGKSLPKQTKAIYSSNKNYYIVVGTYPEHEEAFDTFVRLSSIGLKGATMESRTTKSGKNLHMVRLGPFKNQEDIDKVKDTLTNDGLSQFKVVEN